MRLIVGISGATGAIYGIRLLQVLQRASGVETDLIITGPAQQTIEYETEWRVEQVKALATGVFDVDDLMAGPSSGSYRRDGMVVIPCSIKTMSALAYSHSDNLLVRAGDVTLKERKPLVLVVRESPLHLGHLRSMAQLTEMGATILPPVPSFYQRPKTIDDIVDHTVARVLDFFSIPHDLSARWKGLPGNDG
ncbi:MAG: UbiX family flavin prenyltransferase [Chloroflexota bacterium]